MTAISAKEAREYITTITMQRHGVIELKDDKKIIKVIDHYGKHQGFFPKIGVLFHRILNILAAVVFVGTEKKRGKNQAKVLVEEKYFKNEALKTFYEQKNNKEIKGKEKKEACSTIKWGQEVSKILGSMLVDSYIETTKLVVNNKEELNTKCEEIFKKNFTEDKIKEVLNKRPKTISDEKCNEICTLILQSFQKNITV